MASQLAELNAHSPSPARKSRRLRKPTKYALDALDPLKDIFSDTEESEPTRKRRVDLDDEFDDDVSMDDDVFEAEELEVGDLGERSPSENSDNAEDNDMEDVVGGDAGRPTGASIKDFARKLAKMKNDGRDQRTVIPYTGRLEGHLAIPYHDLRNGPREDFLRAIFGPEEDDLEKILGVQVRWQSDPVLPQRIINAEGEAGVALTPWYSDERRADDLENAWTWLNEDDSPKKKQVVTQIADGQEVSYMPRHADESAFLLGPHADQTLYTLHLRDSMNFARAWHKGDEELEQKGTREGWIVNVGGRIQTMEWAPNRANKNQILAISLCTEDLTGNRKRSVYMSNPGPSCIQLWDVSSKRESKSLARLDMETSPELIQVICTGWGELKQLRWCPVFRKLPDNEFGLMATVWGDGKVRVLDIGTAEPIPLGRKHSKISATLCLEAHSH